MQTLIIGNGFDIDHNLPTKYKDFLSFVEEMNYIKSLGTEGKIRKYLEGSEIKNYIKELYFSEDKKEIKREALSLLDNNMWLHYFLGVKGEIGENWIDFESEISQVVQELENVKEFVVSEMKKGTTNIVVPDYMKKKLDKLSFDAVLVYKDGSQKDITEYITRWITDLSAMIRLLEIYLCDFVQNLKIEFFSPDVFELNPDHVISFNYTNTYEKMYSYKRNAVRYNYIHGKAALSNTVDSCNMVLGIDEYLDENKRNLKTEFIQFKKYFQRIHKKTDCDYVYWFDKNNTSESYKKNENEIYVFGHSLDITDGDIFEKILNVPNTRVIIYYYDENVYGNQIANLVSLLGQDVMLNKVYGKNPSIIFKKQQNHRKIPNSEFEVVADMYKLRHLYEYNNEQAQQIVNSVIEKIDACSISYFGNQKNIVNMYDILRELRADEDNRSKLLSFAKVVYDDMLSGKKIFIDQSEWEYDDYDGHHYCDNKTAQFIREINKYNMEQYEKKVFSIHNEMEKEEEHLLYPDKIEESYSIEDYERTFQYAIKKINTSVDNTRAVLNALVAIALHFDRSEIKRFYNEKAKSIRNPVLQSRINYILSCYEEELYLEYQASQYEASQYEGSIND